MNSNSGAPEVQTNKQTNRQQLTCCFDDLCSLASFGRCSNRLGLLCVDEDVGDTDELVEVSVKLEPREWGGDLFGCSLVSVAITDLDERIF